ncbi:MAG: dolichyl-phosphate-mannose--protein mannosyltransferase [Muribaculaceae bacterium]|nr:dolichyl-phosphate-mannose--protein mannosyltransferase [Muribaculaceae bacterium]
MTKAEFKNSTWWIYAAVALAALPVLLFRDFTPDNELRYLSIADEALRDGAMFCFTNHGAAYADKPPLYLWAVMAGKAAFGGHHMWFLALFSLVPMLLVGRIMDRWAARHMPLRQRRTALLMLFTCGYFPALGLTLRMDMLMTLWIVLALRQVWRIASDSGAATRSSCAMLGLYTFLALFTKGPLGVIIPLLGSAAWLLWTGRARLWLRCWSWPAWAVLLGGCALWFGCVWHEGGQAYLDNLLFHQTIDRARDAFHHKRPFYYYAIAIWYVMAPWSLLLLYRACTLRGRIVQGPYRKLMLAVPAVTFAVLSCISSKLQVYLLPAIPFAVYLCASWPCGPRLERAVRVFAAAVGILVFAAGCALPWLNPAFGYGDACRRAAALKPTMVIVDSAVRRGENIDAYFSCPVTVADSHAQEFSLPAGAVLISPGSDRHNRISISYEPNR